MLCLVHVNSSLKVILTVNVNFLLPDSYHFACPGPSPFFGFFLARRIDLNTISTI